ncbi:Calponin homology domain [Dillenia turbinata]|uniref:Calponin homology domain n=1 Tax=Dillenia turbinata TaxID=194707 RepID=A0AAN8VT47_9MAGN
MDFSINVASVVEDVLQQHGTRLKDLDMESRKAEEAASRRSEAAGWLRKMVGVVGAKDLPAEPSEEEFRLGLRSGLILCIVLNKVQPGAVPKVVESPCDSTLIPDGAALSAYQYFENVRNFLVAVQEMGLPTFEASDLEQGGKSARVVNCVLALKSYSEWKQTGGNGVWKFGGTVKSVTSGKSFSHMRKNSEPFTNSLARNLSANEKSLNAPSSDLDSSKMPGSRNLAMLIRSILSDKKPEEYPMLVESVLTKIIEEYEVRIATQNEERKTSSKGSSVSNCNKFFSKSASADVKVEERNVRLSKREESQQKKGIADDKLKSQSIVKQQMIFDQQHRDIQDLKNNIHTTKAGMQFMQMKLREEFHNIGMHIQGLAHAASGYHRVLEENRKLYNQVQDLKGSIRVYCRVRPFLGGHSSYLSTVVDIQEGIITVNTPAKNGKGCKTFSFNKMGPKELREHSQGVNYRALSDLFLLSEQRKDTFRYDVSVQMIEIYNEQVRDLLVADGLSVPDACLVPVSSTSDIINLMNLGQRNRAVGATALNDRSSRSHSCLTVHVQGRELTSGTILRGCMHLVDLAGSERVNKSEVTGDRLKEAQHINKSLSALGDVISSLAQKNAHVPYRNCKLTQLLQDSLGGQAKTLMFVHISPEPDANGETISTLKFAERVATVELGAARVNKDSSDVKELKEQIASLKAALARKEGKPENFLNLASISPYQSNGQGEHTPSSGDQTSCRLPMGDVGNIQFGIMTPMYTACQVHDISVLRQKKQSYDFDELLANSPPWPPVPGQSYGEDDREPGSGEWVDKVMVNKQDRALRTENPLGCWEPENKHLPNLFYQNYHPDSSKLFQDQSYNMFISSNQFEVTNINDLDEVDAATSDSSEPDLLWQFNHSRIPSMANGFGTKTKRPSPMVTKNPELSKKTSPSGPSPSQKLSNGLGPRGGRLGVPSEGKRRTGNKK